MAAEAGEGEQLVLVYIDSQGALSFTHNSITSMRLNLIDVQHHLLRECVARGDLRLYCATWHTALSEAM